MANLKIAIIRTHSRIQQSKNDLSCLEKIVITLNKILELKRKNTQIGSSELTSIASSLKLVSRNVTRMNVRRGSLVLRHEELPWKHLNFLESAIDHVSVKNMSLLQQTVLAIVASNDIELLLEQFQLMVQEEQQQLKKLDMIFAALSYQQRVLANLTEELSAIKAEHSHYKTIYGFLTSILDHRTNTASVTEMQEQKTKKIRELKEYYITHRKQFPDYLNNLLSFFNNDIPEGFLEGNFPTELLEKIYPLVTSQMQYLKDNLDKLEQTQREINQGIPKLPSDIYSFLAKTLETLEEIKALTDKNKHSNSLQSFLAFRKNISSHLIEYNYFFYKIPPVEKERLFSLLHTILGLNHPKTLHSEQQFQEKLNEFIRLTQRFIKDFYPAKHNINVLNTLSNKVKTSWKGIQNFKEKQSSVKSVQPSPTKSRETVLDDFKGALIQLTQKAIPDHAPCNALLIDSIREEIQNMSIISLEINAKTITEIITNVLVNIENTHEDKSINDEQLASVMAKINEEEEAQQDTITSNKAKKIDITTTINLTAYTLDIQNIKMMSRNIDALLSAFKNFSLSDQHHAIVFKRAFLKTLILLGESSKDLSIEFKSTLPNFPWKLLGKIRNSIFHDGIDLPDGRKILDSFFAAPSLDVSENINLPVEYTDMLCQCMFDLENIKNNLDTLLVSQEAIVANDNMSGTLPKYQFTPKKIKKSQNISNPNSAIAKIIKFNQQEKEGSQQKILFSTGLNSLFKLLKNSDANSKPYGVKYENTCIELQTIESFLEEIMALEAIFNTQNKDISQELKRSALEFSIAYLGELSRLLKDNSKVFQDYASVELLVALEQLIIKRGKIAHSSAFGDINIDENSYREIIYFLKPFLQIAKNAIRLHVIRNDYSQLEQAFRNHKRDFKLIKFEAEHNLSSANELRVWVEENESLSPSLKELIAFVDAINFYDEESKKVSTERQRNLSCSRVFLLAKIAELKISFIELKLILEDNSHDALTSNYDYTDQQHQDIQLFIQQINAQAVLTFQIITSSFTEEFSKPEYDFIEIMCLKNKIDQHTISKSDFDQRCNSLDSQIGELLQQSKNFSAINSELSQSLQLAPSFAKSVETLNELHEQLVQLNTSIQNYIEPLLTYPVEQLLTNNSVENKYLFLSQFNSVIYDLKEKIDAITSEFQVVSTAMELSRTAILKKLSMIPIEQYQASNNKYQKEFSDLHQENYKKCATVLTKFSLHAKMSTELKKSQEKIQKIEVLSYKINTATTTNQLGSSSMETTSSAVRTLPPSPTKLSPTKRSPTKRSPEKIIHLKNADPSSAPHSSSSATEKTVGVAVSVQPRYHAERKQHPIFSFANKENGENRLSSLPVSPLTPNRHPISSMANDEKGEAAPAGSLSRLPSPTNS